VSSVVRRRLETQFEWRSLMYVSIQDIKLCMVACAVVAGTTRGKNAPMDEIPSESLQHVSIEISCLRVLLISSDRV
jgi:hypothetical protein